MSLDPHGREQLSAVAEEGVLASTAEVVAEAGGWSVFIPGLPVAADGASLDEAVREMVDALREYADDWQDRLHRAPGHREHRELVQLITTSDDQHLAAWLVRNAM